MGPAKTCLCIKIKQSRIAADNNSEVREGLIMAMESIPAAKRDASMAEKPDVALKKQLQQEGLRQAREFQQLSQTSQATQVSVSQTRVAASVFVSSFEQQVVVDERRFDNRQFSDIEEENKSAFDFEKVADNVLKFVGGVIRGAGKGGATEEKLADLIGQARSGVAKGIALAEKDLAGFMNQQISDGIRNSKEAIDNGINDIEKEVLSPFSSDISTGTTIGGSLSDTKSSSLLIRTKDGDEVEVNFGQASQLRYNASTQSDFLGNQGDSDAEATTDLSGQHQSSVSLEYFEYRGISFSVKGELDKDELGAISDLVKQITDVSKTFFKGDLDEAFEKALDLGYDENELAGFALKLNRQTVVSEKISAYESVNEGDTGKLKQYMRPIQEYMQQLKSLDELLTNTLKDGEGYQELVNGVINQMTEVHVPDVLSAINRFHQFNGRMNALKKEAE